MKKIRVHPAIKKEIAEELKVTYQTVTMSLEYVFNSEKAKQIRQRAKQSLIKESKKIKE